MQLHSICMPCTMWDAVGDVHEEVHCHWIWFTFTGRPFFWNIYAGQLKHAKVSGSEQGVNGGVDIFPLKLIFLILTLRRGHSCGIKSPRLPCQAHWCLSCFYPLCYVPDLWRGEKSLALTFLICSANLFQRQESLSQYFSCLCSTNDGATAQQNKGRETNGTFARF